MNRSARRRPEVTAETIGRVAARLMIDGRHGRVIAVMPRSIYIEMPAGIGAIVNKSLGKGPLAIGLAAEAGGLDGCGVAVGDNVEVRSQCLSVGPLDIDASRADLWAPAIATGVLGSSAAAAAGRIIRNVVRSAAARGGLGSVAADLPDATSDVGRAGAAAYAEYKVWLAGALQADATEPCPLAPSSLLGLGPGLTPSGDDALAGSLVALRAAGAARVHRAIADRIAADGPRLTSPISYAHLSAASEGLVSETVWALAEALVTNQPCALERSANDVASQGHSSGVDCLAGVLAVLDALCELRSG